MLGMPMRDGSPDPHRRSPNCRAYGNNRPKSKFGRIRSLHLVIQGSVCFRAQPWCKRLWLFCNVGKKITKSKSIEISRGVIRMYSIGEMTSLSKLD
jgi:hypothetical protein